MKKISKILRKSFFYLLSILLLSYVLVSIGINNIFQALISTDLLMVFVAILFTFSATMVRMYKFRILLNFKDKHTLLEVFISSRIGKEISFAGFFIPLIKKNNRKDGTFHNLILDRYTEIYATLILALISCFFVFKTGYAEIVVFSSIAGCSLIMTIIPFVNTSYVKRLLPFNFIIKIVDFVTILQEKLKFNSKYIFGIYLLSVLATILDFITAFFVYRSCSVHINFMLIPVVWAASGLVSIFAFMIIGSTEISVIYLYYLFAGVNKALTTSFVIISRLMNVIILILLFFYIAAFNKIKKKIIPVN